MDRFHPDADFLADLPDKKPYFRVGNIMSVNQLEGSTSKIRPPRGLATVTFTYKKRYYGWKMTTIAHIMAEVTQLDDVDGAGASGPTTLAASQVPVSCVIRKIRNWTDDYAYNMRRQPNWQATTRNVVAVSSTLFPPNRRTVWAAVGRKNKSSTLVGLTERALKPVESTETGRTRLMAKQPLRGTARLMERKVLGQGKPKVKSIAAHCVRAMQRGTVYDIALVDTFSPRFFRKDRHARGLNRVQRGKKSRVNAKLLHTDYTGEDALAAHLDQRMLYPFATDAEYAEERDDEFGMENQFLPDPVTATLEQPATVWTMEELISFSAKQRINRRHTRSSGI